MSLHVSSSSITFVFHHVSSTLYRTALYSKIMQTLTSKIGLPFSDKNHFALSHSWASMRPRYIEVIDKACRREPNFADLPPRPAAQAAAQGMQTISTSWGSSSQSHPLSQAQGAQGIRRQKKEQTAYNSLHFLDNLDNVRIPRLLRALLSWVYKYYISYISCILR